MGWASRGVCDFKWSDRDGLVEKVTFEQRSEGGGGVRLVNVLGGRTTVVEVARVGGREW